MTKSFREIRPPLARRLRLVMTDVDGTLSADSEHFQPLASESISLFQEDGIIVGLVSGRTMPRLDKLVPLLGVRGPLIAENGGVARLKPGEDLVNLGHTRQPALEALFKLKGAFPCIREQRDNNDRMVDVSIDACGVSAEDLRSVASDVEIFDSGYMVHLIAPGISKGGTLLRLLSMIDGGILPEEIIVFGDSTTDASLFQLFPNSVLINNPLLSCDQKKTVESLAAYRSELPVEQGFAEVAQYIIRSRSQT